MDAPEPTGRTDSEQEVSTDRHEPALRVTRRLSRVQQFAMLGVAALLLVALLAGQALWHAIRPQAAPEAAPAQPASGNAFRPTPQQWAGFRIQPAEEKPFRPAQDTDGKIAIDDDLVTPVFSPYSGRVVKLFASAGDTVRQGDPLFAVQASEFVQAQNDLIAGVATLRTARAQANLAETNEKRQHELYLAHGAALKDWQQAQVDLASAQGDLSSAQIALCGGAQPAAHPGAQRRRNRGARKRPRPAEARSGGGGAGADRRHGDPAPGRAGPDHRQRRCRRDHIRCSRSATCPRSGWWQTSARRMRR